MSNKIPQHLVKTNAWFDKSSFGIQYEAPYLAFRKLTVGGPVSASEAKIGAEKIGAKDGIPVLDYRQAKKDVERIDIDAAPEKITESIRFRSDVVAIPTLGGIITDLPLSAESKMRFPPDVCLRVSEKVVNDHNFVIVNFDGEGVALHPEEADGLGLKEVQNWLPDMTGISSVPRRGEIERHLQR